MTVSRSTFLPAAVVVLMLVIRGQGALASTVVPIPRLPIECHSFNDIDIWPQLLHKGVRYIKTDHSYCTLEACTQFSTFNTGPGTGSLADCYHSRDNNTYCCMCMRGDASTRPYLLSPFNTTADLVLWLGAQASAGAPFLPTAASSPHLMLGLDFGGVGVDFTNVTERALWSTFLLGLNATIAAHGIGLTPYFDATISGWFQALDLKCAAGECTPAEQQLQSLPWPSEAGDSLPPQAQDPYNRYAILNSDESDLYNDCNASSWNASLQKSNRYPYLWYEPSSQIEYEGFFDFWRQCPTVPADKRSPNLGVVVVSNQASEMFETYASGGIGRGLNQVALSANHTNAKVVLVPIQSHAFDRAALVFTQLGPCVAVTPFGVVDGSMPQPLAAPECLMAGSLVSAAASASGASPDGTSSILVASADGAYMQVQWNATSSMLLVPGGTGAFPFNGTLLAAQQLSPTANSTAILASNASGVYVAVVDTTGALVEAHLLMESVGVQGASLSLVASDGIYTGLVVYAAPDNLNTSLRVAQPSHMAEFESAVEAALNAGCKDGAAWYARGDHTAARCNRAALATAWKAAYGSWRDRSEQRYWSEEDPASHTPISDPTVADSTRSALYGAYIEVHPDSPPGGGLLVVEQGRVGAGLHARIGLGAFPHVDTYSANGTVMALLSATHGTCQCGLLQNNDDTPHCLLATPAADANPLLYVYQSVQYLLNYNYGKLDAFRRLLNGSTTAPLDAYLSMCNTEIMSGKFENGASVSGALYTRTVQYINATEGSSPVPVPEVAALFVHDGNVVCPIVTTVVCGSPIQKVGIAFDEFRLTQPVALP